MKNRSRRTFLADVGRGMLIASVGPTVAADLGLAKADALDGPERLSFGEREPLVSLMQETPIARLLPAVVEKMQSGTDLDALVAAAALANARAFGGQDYTGYHAFMALMPAYLMARELPAAQRALPVLKVLYRNTSRIHATGTDQHEVLHPITGSDVPVKESGAKTLREATRRGDMDRAERTFAGLVHKSVEGAFNDLQFSIQDEIDVHRVVLAWRAWSVLDLAGPEQAHTLLRQSVRFCVDEDRARMKHGESEVRRVLPRVMDQHRLVGRPLGKRRASDSEVEHLAAIVYGTDRARAAEAVGAALAEGMSPDSVAEAVSLAANRLVLCDPGRSRSQAEPGKPEGSVHGASVGVHASDAANAWRNIARISDPRNTVASLIVGAYHTAGQSGQLLKRPYPLPEQLEKIRLVDAPALLRATDAAIREKDQARACALVQRYAEQEHPARPVFDLLLRYAVSQDGALHAEKYYRTVTEEFASSRPAFRWRQLVALARVTASEYGFPAPGYREACRLLKV